MYTTPPKSHNICIQQLQLQYICIQHLQLQYICIQHYHNNWTSPSERKLLEWDKKHQINKQTNKQTVFTVHMYTTPTITIHLYTTFTFTIHLYRTLTITIHLYSTTNNYMYKTSTCNTYIQYICIQHQQFSNYICKQHHHNYITSLYYTTKHIFMQHHQLLKMFKENQQYQYICILINVFKRHL